MTAGSHTQSGEVKRVAVFIFREADEWDRDRRALGWGECKWAGVASTVRFGLIFLIDGPLI